MTQPQRPPPPTADPIAAVGPRIRALRDAMSPLPARPGRALRRLRPDAVAGRARGDVSPTLAVAAKIAAGLELTLSQLLRLDEGQHVAVSRAGERRRSRRGGHSIEELTPPLPGPARRRLAARPRPRRHHRRRRRPADARAGQPRDRGRPRRRRWRWSSTAPATSFKRGTASPSTPICRTISRTKATNRPASSR